MWLVEVMEGMLFKSKPRTSNTTSLWKLSLNARQSLNCYHKVDYEEGYTYSNQQRS
ncbi:hypothetical protein BH09PAT4_BH09PAT4_09200 [soil metagenome]